MSKPDNGQQWAVRLTHKNGRKSYLPQPSRFMAELSLAGIPAMQKDGLMLDVAAARVVLIDQAAAVYNN